MQQGNSKAGSLTWEPVRQSATPFCPLERRGRSFMGGDSDLRPGGQVGKGTGKSKVSLGRGWGAVSGESGKGARGQTGNGSEIWLLT